MTNLETLKYYMDATGATLIRREDQWVLIKDGEEFFFDSFMSLYSFMSAAIRYEEV